ncbi:VWA domain-containing protein [Candidatus Electronema sp. PJ]|uniref:vWA domain-containing protein n=1 Tax=Candidatus Electronema sp. PJ TaxID=3401572 RepID=UPI003AA8C17D
MPSFVQPFWLLVGLLACCAAALFISFSTFRRRQKLAQFAAPQLLPILTANVSQARRRLKAALFVLGLACLFLALARPQWGNRWIEVRRKGIDILIGFDVSKSMLAPDIKPSRLQRAKLAVRDFTARLHGDRIGLLPFAGTSFLSCPLTTDYDAFNASLDALDTNTIPKGGTNIGRAIEDAGQVLAGELNYKILILITDGEDLSQDALKAAAVAKQEKMLIYTVGVGTPQGELIPLPDPGNGAEKFIKNEQGEFVTSKLDEKTLLALAETTGGMYVPLGSMGQGLDAIYERKLALIPKEEQAQRKKKVAVERFQWPLAAAVFLFSMEFLLIGRRRKLHLPFIFTAGRRKKQQTAAVLLLCALCSTLAQADQGSDLYQAKQYEQAAQFYQDALAKDRSNPTLHFNLGAALHKQGKYDEAVAEFNQALQTDDLTLQAKSYFNRGISHYQAGTAAEAAHLEQAIQQLRWAKHAFESVLKLKPKDNQARLNLETVKKKLAELEQKQKEQQEQQQAQNKENNEKQKKDAKQDSEDKKQESGSEQKQNEPEKQPPQDKDNGQKQEDKGKQPENGSQEKQQENAAPAPDKEQKKADETAADKQQPETPPPQDKQDKEGAKMMGKMTKEEAQNLLDSLKNEQGELNFLPQEAADGESVGRDW